MSQEVLTPPIESEIIPADRMAKSMESFDAFTKGMDVPTPTQEALAKPQEVKPPETKQDAPAVNVEQKKGIPDALLIGEPEKKPEVDPNAEEAELQKLLNDTPEGQIRHENYKKVQAGAKKAVEAARAEAARYKADAEKASQHNGNGKLPEDVQKRLSDYEAQIKQHREELERVAYERSPAFQEKYVAREKSLRGDLNAIAKDLSIPDDTIEGALHASPRRRYELIDGLDIPESAKADLTAILRQHDQIQADKKQALDRSAEEIAEYRRSEQQKHEELMKRQAQEEDKVFGEELESALKKLAPYQKQDGHDDWNKTVDQRIQMARDFFAGKSDLRGMAQISLKGLAYDGLMDINMALRDRLKSALEENGKLKSASPGGGGAPALNGEKASSTEERAMQTYDAMMANAANGGFQVQPAAF